MAIQLNDHFTYKKLFKAVIPSVLMMVFISIYSIVDGLFVSNVVGDTAFASLNLVYPVLMIVGAIGFMIGAGGSALVSKTLGEGDKNEEGFTCMCFGTDNVICGLFGEGRRTETSGPDRNAIRNTDRGGKGNDENGSIDSDGCGS